MPWRGMFVLSSALLLLAACGPAKAPPPIRHVLGTSVGPIDDARRNVAAHNSCVLQRYRHEREFYHHDKTQQTPDLCVAFSGGGLRATHYAIGAPIW